MVWWGLVALLLRQRIMLHLDLDCARALALTTFHQPGRAVFIGAPGSATLPARLGIVDAAVEPLGVEAHRIGDAQHDHRAAGIGDEPVLQVGGGDRHILAQAKRVVLIDLGSGLIDHIQKITVAAMQIVDMKVWRRCSVPVISMFESNTSTNRSWECR